MRAIPIHNKRLNFLDQLEAHCLMHAQKRYGKEKKLKQSILHQSAIMEAQTKANTGIGKKNLNSNYDDVDFTVDEDYSYINNAICQTNSN